MLLLSSHIFDLTFLANKSSNQITLFLCSITDNCVDPQKSIINSGSIEAPST